MKTYDVTSPSFKKAESSFVKKEEYLLETFKRSNQDTCLTHKPAISEGTWVQSGDLLTDCASSVGGELSLGQNLLIAYMPWEGYNFEDAILISERLVMDDLYTSIHIERYELEIQKTKLGIDEITRDIPDVSEKDIASLDSFGVIKIGSWVEEGNILVGKITPINKKKISPYQKLLYTILEKQVRPIKDSSLRAPKGIKAKVIDIKYFLKSSNNKVVNTEFSKKKSITKHPQSLLKASTKRNLNKLNTIKGIKKKVEKSLPSRFFNFRKSQNDEVFANNKKLKKYLNLLPYTKNKKLELPFSEIEKNKGNRLSKINFSFSKIRKNSFNIRFKYLRYVWLKSNKKNKIPLCNPNQRLDSFPHPSVARMHFGTSALFPFGETLRATEGGIPWPVRAGETLARSAQGDTAKALFFGSVPMQERSTDPGGNCYQPGAFGSFVENKKGNRLNINKKKNLKFNLLKKKEFLIKNIDKIHIYLAEKRKIQVGDKMAGRHGNKGIVSQILPIQDMPYLPDGTPIDMVLNPLGVPSRMNVGQIYECLLGLAGKYLGENYKVYSFDEIYGPEASRTFVFNKLYEARIKTGFKWLFDPNTPGKIRLFDGRNGQCFDQKVTAGQSYMLRLVHMVDDKIHMRSTGPYSLVTQQPLRGRSKQGGQRLGEMEVWALEGYGAAFTLLEMLTIKSDDMTGRMTLWSNLILNKDISIGTPESFKVLICELQALCLDIGLFRNINVEFNNKKTHLREITDLMNLP